MTTRDPVLVRLARRYAHAELPGKSFLMRAAGVTRQERWTTAAPRTIRARWHGYSIDLDLSDWFQRHAYFYGRYHELPLQLLMRRLLRPGDTLIDIGANIGMITLLGAWLVGPRGRVIAVEPNPDVGARLRRHVERNHLAHVSIHPVALADAPGELRLRVPGPNIGAGTLGDIPDRYGGHLSAEYPVRVIRGDDLDAITAAGERTLIKIDVEGFETRVLRGLEHTLRRTRATVVTEMNEEMLGMCGSTPAELRAFMEGLGYRGHIMRAAWGLGRRTRLDLRPLQTDSPSWDVAWIHPQGALGVR